MFSAKNRWLGANLSSVDKTHGIEIEGNSSQLILCFLFSNSDPNDTFSFMALLILLGPYKRHRASLNLVTSTRKGKWVLAPKGCRGRCVCTQYTHTKLVRVLFGYSKHIVYMDIQNIILHTLFIVKFETWDVMSKLPERWPAVVFLLRVGVLCTGG